MIEKSVDNVKNIIVSLNCMASFINKRDIKNNGDIDLPYLEGFGQAAWMLWNALDMNNFYFLFLLFF